MQHQAARVTPVHMPKEQSQEEGGDWDEEKWNASTRGSQCRFPTSSVFDASLLPKNGAGKGNVGQFERE